MIHISIRKSTVAIVASILAVITFSLILLYASVPRLPKWEKEKVREAYNKQTIKPIPIVWYDENDYKEECDVFRYLGKFGDCYAFLQIGDNRNDMEGDAVLPYPLDGLSRTVYYHIEARIWLYHTKREFTWAEAHGLDFIEGAVNLCELESLKNREEWLSDELLEELTQDIEEIAREHN